MGAIGVQVDATPAQPPQRVILTGRFVTLCPLDVARHGKRLYAQSHGPGREALWRYLSDGPFEDFSSFLAALSAKAASVDPLFFAILDTASEEPVGYAAFLRIDPLNRVIEVGSILYTPAFQKTAGATEAMYLMARYAFEELKYRRYEWKCNALHEGSRRAALRLGFKFEGTFRQHMIVKGRNRDTAWFSMLDTEWPTRKAAFERWLDPANFDSAGKQKEPLVWLGHPGQDSTSS